MDTRGYGTVLVNRRTGREKIDKGGASATTKAAALGSRT